jgi:hypothetical protein
MPVSTFGYSWGYEKHTQKERASVRVFAGVELETPRGVAAGEPNRSAGGSGAQIMPPDLEEITGGRGFNRDHRTGDCAAIEAGEVKLCERLPGSGGFS